MRIGFDVDGVLASFVPAYQELFVALTGVNLFLPGDDVDPPCWDWPELRGYTAEQTRMVWEHIKLNPTFWEDLGTLPGLRELRSVLRDLEQRHDVYYITSRTGVSVKRQTEAWLGSYLPYTRRHPTVLIAGHRVKGSIAKALRLDVYVDDNWENAQDCACESPLTRTYLLNAAYNRQPLLEEDDPLIVRVDSLAEMFEHEMTNL